MISKSYLIFCFIFLFNLNEFSFEPVRRHNYVGPFSRYPASQPAYYNDENYDYDYLNNISLGRILQDDYSLMQQTDNLSDQVKSSIANKLISLASRLQHAASVILQGTSRRRAHRPNAHRLKPKYGQPPPQTQPNNNNFNPFNSDNQDKRNSSSPNKLQSPKLDSLADDEKNPNPKSTPSSFLAPSDLLSNLSSKPSKDTNAELLGKAKRKDEELDDKKKQDEEESKDGFVKRGKRDLERENENPSVFQSITQRELIDKSNEVRTGYDGVIKLLKNYLEDPPITNKQNLKRSGHRAEQLLENIEQAKKIFVQIEDHVSQQFFENEISNRTQSELLGYFDKVIRVEKNRISQALNEYDSTLATNYQFPATSELAHKNSSSSTSDTSDMNSRQPSSRLVPEYQNDDDRDLNSYVSQRRREIERDRFRSNAARRTSYNNELPKKERATIIVRRIYIPPKVKRTNKKKSNNQ